MEKGKNEYLKPLLKVALPLWLYYILQTLYGISDLFFVGRWTDVASLAGVAVGSQILYVLVVLLSGYASGISVYMKKRYDSGETAETEKALGTATLFFFAVSVLLSVILYLSSGFLVSLAAVPPQAFDETKEYLSICFISLPFITAYIILISLCMTVGKKRSLILNMVSGAAMNMLLDYVFVVRFKLGVSGAAYATTISHLFCAVTGFIVIRRMKTGIHLRAEYLKFDRKTIMDMLSTGHSEAVQNAIVRLALLFVTGIINRRGLADAAAFGIGERIVTLALLFPLAVRNAVIDICRELLVPGQKKIRQARKTNETALLLVLVAGIISVVLVRLHSAEAASIFTFDREVQRKAGEYLAGYCYEILFAGVHYVFTAYMISSRMASLAAVNNIIAVVFFRVPFVYVVSLVYRYSMYELGLASTAGSAISALIGVFIYFYVTRRKKRIEPPSR